MKLVLIEWVDSHAGRGWLDRERIEMAAIPLHCRSVGWLLAKNKKCLVIVPHLSAETRKGTMIQGCGDLTIPARAIVKLTVLRRA